MRWIQRIGIGCCIGAVSVCFGCHHPDALYEEAPRPPIEIGRNYEQRHKYARLEQEYQQVDDLSVRAMTLNQLSAAWDSVNANIIRTQQAVNSQPNLASARLAVAQEYYKKGLLCMQYTQGTLGDYPHDFVFGEQEFYFKEALRQAQKARRLQSNLPEASLLIGEIYLVNNRRDEALDELKRLIVKHQEYARGYYAIGKVYLDAKQYDKAERYFIRAIKLDPKMLDAYYLLGQFYLERSWYDYAAYTFLEILRRQPADTATLDLLVDSCHKLGDYYVEDGQFDKAINLFNAVLDVRSSHPVYQSLLRAKKAKADAPPEQETAEAVPASMTVETPDTPMIEPVVAPDHPAVPQTDLAPPAPPAVAASENLRKAPAALSNRDVLQAIRERGFHHPNNLSNWGLSGTVEGSFAHAYTVQTLGNANVVIDGVTGLTWQQAGSAEQMGWNEAKAYVQQLNETKYAGFSDWRLPTVEELASLLEFKKNPQNHYIDQVFDSTQSFCWTADTVTTSNAAWAVAFHSGHVYHDALDRGNYVRAVR